MILDRWETLLGSLPADQITSADVTSNLPDGSDRWRNQCLAVLRRVYRWRGLSSPTDGIRQPKVAFRSRYLTSVQIVSFFHQCREFGYPHGHTLRFALLTGLRIGEVFDLRSVDVDSVANRIHIRSKVNPHGRDLHIAGPAMAVLTEAMQLTTADHPFPEKGNQHAWLAIRARLGIQGFRRHDLRHTFASVAVQSGIPLAQIGELLGHEPGSAMTARYSHLAGTKKTASLVGAAFSGLDRA